MDIAKALTFITEDERWVEKLAIGVGIILVSGLLTPMLIGLLGFFIIAGYSIRLLQNVRDGQPRPLPEWNQWSEDFVRGFKIAVVTLIWALPIHFISSSSMRCSSSRYTPTGDGRAKVRTIIADLRRWPST